MISHTHVCAHTRNRFNLEETTYEKSAIENTLAARSIFISVPSTFNPILKYLNPYLSSSLSRYAFLFAREPSLCFPHLHLRANSSSCRNSLVYRLSHSFPSRIQLADTPARSFSIPLALSRLKQPGNYSPRIVTTWKTILPRFRTRKDDVRS